MPSDVKTVPVPVSLLEDLTVLLERVGRKIPALGSGPGDSVVLAQLVQRVEQTTSQVMMPEEPVKSVGEDILSRAYLKAAELYTREGELEVDDNAETSIGGGPGAYIQSWLWISHAEVVGALREILIAENKTWSTLDAEQLEWLLIDETGEDYLHQLTVAELDTLKVHPQRSQFTQKFLEVLNGDGARERVA